MHVVVIVGARNGQFDRLRKDMKISLSPFSYSFLPFFIVSFILFSSLRFFLCF
jgi:hypothetical protein